MRTLKGLSVMSATGWELFRECGNILKTSGTNQALLYLEIVGTE